MSKIEDKIKVGDNAPNFAAQTQNGELKLSDLRGKNVVLYFYPKDDTPGCTIEAQDFTGKNKEFDKFDTVILGVSKDNIKSHEKFCEKYKISFDLISDEDTSICQLYGVLKEKSMFGKKYMGIERSTFLIDKLGRVIKIWRSVKVKGHAEEVLEEIKNYKL